MSDNSILNDLPQDDLKRYPVWDRPVRIFHWLNVFCLLMLISIGVVIYFNKDLGVSPDGKILLKMIHVWFGYLFVTNLSIRLIWSFFGNRFARWGAILPIGKAYRASLIPYLKGGNERATAHYRGHNPVGRLMVALLFLLLISQAMTGLVLAGTDLYWPPFGSEIAEWVTGDDQNRLQLLKPGSKEHVVAEHYQAMRAFRKPFITLHKYIFYTLLVAIFLHIVGVIIGEIKERSGLISAMFTGDKVFSKKPIDLE